MPPKEPVVIQKKAELTNKSRIDVSKERNIFIPTQLKAKKEVSQNER